MHSYKPNRTGAESSIKQEQGKLRNTSLTLQCLYANCLMHEGSDSVHFYLSLLGVFCVLNKLAVALLCASCNTLIVCSFHNIVQHLISMYGVNDLFTLTFHEE